MIKGLAVHPPWRLSKYGLSDYGQAELNRVNTDATQGTNPLIACDASLDLIVLAGSDDFADPRSYIRLCGLQLNTSTSMGRTFAWVSR